MIMQKERAVQIADDALAERQIAALANVATVAHGDAASRPRGHCQHGWPPDPKSSGLN